MTNLASADAQKSLSAASIAGRVYLAVQAAGPVGVSSGGLRASRRFRSLNPSAVEHALYRLKGLGYITFDRKASSFSVAGASMVPTMRYPKPARSALLDMVADCEAGLAVQVLADEFGTRVEEVLAVLDRDLRMGRVLSVPMPDSHGGGMGLAPNPAGQAAGRPAPTAALPQRLPLPPLVVPTFLEAAPAAPKPAAGRGAFELLPTGQFSMGWGAGFQLVLPRDVTREMFRFLDRLGGLSTEARLGQAETDQAADAGAAS